MLVMNISKAYDSVSGSLMLKALERLKVPNEFIEIVELVFYNRKNRVIVGESYTDYYEVEDGLDQARVKCDRLYYGVYFLIRCYVSLKKMIQRMK